VPEHTECVTIHPQLPSTVSGELFAEPRTPRGDRWPAGGERPDIAESGWRDRLRLEAPGHAGGGSAKERGACDHEGDGRDGRGYDEEVHELRPDVEHAREHEQVERHRHRGGEVEDGRDLGPQRQAAEKQYERGYREPNEERSRRTAELGQLVGRPLERKDEPEEEEAGGPIIAATAWPAGSTGPAASMPAPRNPTAASAAQSRGLATSSARRRRLSSAATPRRP
jgi:hypothetical protein